MKTLGRAIALGLLPWLPIAGVSQAIPAAPELVQGELDGTERRLRDGSLYDVHYFAGKRGSTIVVTLESAEFDTYLVVFGPDGEAIARQNDGDGTNARRVIRLPQDGRYRVWATSNRPGDQGTYRLQWRSATTAETAQLEKHQTAEALVKEGTNHYLKGEFRDALKDWQAALILFRAVGDLKGEGNTFGNIGLTYDALGEYERAIGFHRQNLTIARTIGDRTSESNALINIGSAHLSLGQYQRAIDVFDQALIIKRADRDVKGTANVLGNLGITYYSLGQYRRAIELYNQALTLDRETGDRRGEAASLGSLGSVYSALGQYRRAIDFHRQSLDIHRDTGDRQGEATALGNLGVAHHSLEEYEQAIDFHNQSLGIKRAIGSRQGEANSLANLGLAYDALKQYDRAVALHQQSLTLFRELGSRREAAIALGNLGITYDSLGQYEQALEVHQQSLTIARDIGDRRGEALILGNIGVVYQSLEQYDRAESFFRRSLAVTETLEKELGKNDRDRISFFETNAVIYSALTQLLITQGKTEHALVAADRSRARSLVQFLNSSTSDQPSTPLNINQIKQLARDTNATLITYSTVEKDLYIWVVSPTGELNFVRAEPEAAGLYLRQASQDIRSAATFGTFNDQLFNQSKYRIDLLAMRGDGTGPLWAGSPEYLERGYQLLIHPIEEHLPKAPGSRLIIVPHRELGTVPFAALFKEGQGFLIDRYTITVTPSLQILHTLQHATSTAKGAPLVVGNPSPMPDQLSPLPGSEIEATAIAQKLNTPPILGNQATEAAINAKLSTANILHFATHGVIPKSDRDLNSWLALADIGSDDTIDNKLTISEIFNSNLNAQLAVLSACNTNSGEISGEGVVGLARAFLKAGVPTVVASSWKVPDRETQMLMEAFYDQLLAGKTYAEALRAAQLKVRAQSPNPFAWAAFSVIGEGDRTLIKN